MRFEPNHVRFWTNDASQLEIGDGVKSLVHLTLLCGN